MSVIDNTIVSLSPPAASRPVVIARRRTLELERDALRAGAARFALASARGDLSARKALAEIPAKLAALQFEIDLNQAVQELAEIEDAAAEIAWRGAIQHMDPVDIIAGIGKEACCKRCMPGISGGCVLTGNVPGASGRCLHPLKEKHLFHLTDSGKRIFPHRMNPHASMVFDAACARLGVAEGEFS